MENAPSAEDWQRLATTIRRRRLELSLTQREAVEQAGGGISLPVWSLLESGRQTKYRERTFIAAARALSWPSDALERILAGDTRESFGGDDDTTSPGGAAAFPPQIDTLAAKVTELAATVEQQQAQIAELLQALNDPTRRRTRPSPPAEQDD